MEVTTIRFEITEDRMVRVTSPNGSEHFSANVQKGSLREWTIQTLIEWLKADRLKPDGISLLGAHLYDAFFQAALKKTLEDHRNRADRFLNLELAFDYPADEIATWPYEYIYCPTPGQDPPGYFVLEDPRVALTRVPNVPPRRTIRVREEVLRVLCVASSPNDELPIGFTDVIKQITDLQIVNGRQQFELLDPLVTEFIPREELDRMDPRPVPKATWKEFGRTLEQLRDQNKSPHVIHFIGHGKCDGDVGKVAFVNPDFTADWKDGQTLAKAVENSSVNLVFLQSCETAKSTAVYSPYVGQSNVAKALAGKSIPAVIAMRSKVKVIAANDFAVTFYKSLAKMMPVYQAVQAGRGGIAASDLDALGIPILYLLRKDGEDGVLFPVPAQQVALGSRLATSGARTSASTKCKCVWCWRESRASSARCSYQDCRAPLRCPGCGSTVDSEDKLEDNQVYHCEKCGREFDKKGVFADEDFERGDGFGSTRGQSPAPEKAGHVDLRDYDRDLFGREAPFRGAG